MKIKVISKHCFFCIKRTFNFIHQHINQAVSFIQIYNLLLTRKTKKVKKKIVRNATVLNDGSIIRVRREKSTDESDEEYYTETSSDEDKNEDEKQDTEAEVVQQEIKEKTPEPEGACKNIVFFSRFEDIYIYIYNVSTNFNR